MLSSQELHYQLQHPHECTSAQLDDFRTLTELYPYTPSFSILYLKTLANAKDVRLANQVEKLAFKIANRALLYELLQQLNETPQASEAHLPNETPQLSESPQQSESPQETAVPLQPTTAVLPELDELEKGILSGVIATSFLELAHDATAELPEDTLVAPTPIIPLHTPEKVTTKSLQETAPTTARSFSDWLHFNEASPDAKPDFVEIEKPKATFYSASKKAKESLDAQQTPVSETLAQIYALQGNIAMAIKAYEQLSLLNPEKKSFFATQIKNLTKKLT
ncbi:MAG: hypothetical protein RLZZ301_1493 [Bacteroidota bacterium]|jgi:hypothetical protein